MTNKKGSERKEDKGSYREWLSNAQSLKNVKKLIEKSGIPLELKTRQILKNGNYLANPSYYKTPDDKGNVKNREIDIYALKTMDSLKVDDSMIFFHALIIGDCKYSTTNDFLVVESDQRLSRSFPVVFNHRKLFGLTPELNFKFPIIMQNVIEIDVAGNNVHPEARVIYEGCSQIIDAFAYFIDETRRKDSNRYGIPFYNNPDLNKKFSEYVKEKNLPTNSLGAANREVIVDFVKSKIPIAEVLKMFGHVNVYIGVPILVVGENNGILSVTIKEGKVQDIQDVGYGAYLFAPSELPKWIEPLLGSSRYLPIIICNVNKLDNCLRDVENGLYQMIKDAKATLVADPFRIIDAICDFISTYYSSPFTSSI